MRKYFTLLFCLCILLTCLTGCGLSREQLSEYQVLDYNIVWEDTQRTIHSQGMEKYYQIKDVSQDEYIAVKGYDYNHGIGGYPYEPTVLVHSDKGSTYQLDTASGKLIARCGLENTGENEYWESLGKQLRIRVLVDIDENLSKEIVKAITAKSPDYVGSDKYGYTSNLTHLKFNDEEKFVYLGIQYTVQGYDNLTWMATILQLDQNQYVIETADKANRYEMKYIRCNEELNAIINEIVNQYNLK